jgi:hypothetical protein
VPVLVLALYICDIPYQNIRPQLHTGKDEMKGKMLSEMSFADLGLSSGLKNVDNEIEILKSRTLVQRVVKKLNLNTSF